MQRSEADVSMPYIDMETTGKMLKAVMGEKGFSAKEIAEILGISRNAVYFWWEGKRLPSVDNLVCMAYVMETKIDDLIGIKYV